jgi:ABC-type spermidine/putrescine transport system permease subunit II
VVIAVVVALSLLVLRSPGHLESEATLADVEPVRTPTTAGRVRLLISSVLFGMCYLFLYAPLFIVALFSFNKAEVPSFPLTGFALHWYRVLLDSPPLLEALQRTLIVGLLATLLAGILGAWFAIAIYNKTARTGSLLQGAITLPMLLPGVILGLTLAIAFRGFGVPNGIPALVLAHLTFTTPIVLAVVLQRLRKLDPALFLASHDLGGNAWRTYLHVVLPQIRTAWVASLLLAFTLSFDEVLVSYFVAGNNPTLPVYVYNQARFGFTPSINAIFTVIGTVSLTVVIIGLRSLRKGGVRV